MAKLFITRPSGKIDIVENLEFYDVQGGILEVQHIDNEKQKIVTLYWGCGEWSYIDEVEDIKPFEIATTLPPCLHFYVIGISKSIINNNHTVYFKICKDINAPGDIYDCFIQELGDEGEHIIEKLKGSLSKQGLELSTTEGFFEEDYHRPDFEN